MASKKHNHSRHTRRHNGGRVVKVVADTWLLVLASHITATAVIMAIERVLNVPR